MKKILIILILFFNINAFEFLNEDLKQGDGLVLYELDQDYKNFIAYLKKNDKTLTASSAFLIEKNNKKIWVLALGLSPEFKEGKYNLELKITEKDNKIIFIEKEIIINKSVYLIETLNMNNKSSDLILKPDPKKAEESKVLSKILMVFNKEINTFDLFKEPIKKIFYTATFGDQRKYIYSDSSTSLSYHKGLDYRGAIGTAVFAPSSAKVVLATKRILTGNSIVLEHYPGIYSLYYHLSKINIEEGEIVKQGQKIGEVGDTGFVTGPHLHWEFRIRGQAVNPLFFVRNNIINNKKIDSL